MNDMLSYVRAYLEERRGRWPDICEETGLSYHWLTKFAQGRVKNPGYGHIQRLYDHAKKYRRYRSNAA